MNHYRYSRVGKGKKCRLLYEGDEMTDMQVSLAARRLFFDFYSEAFSKVLFFAAFDALSAYQNGKKEEGVEKLECLLSFSDDDFKEIERERRISNVGDSWTISSSLAQWIELKGKDDGDCEYITPLVHGLVCRHVPGNKSQDCETYDGGHVSIKVEYSISGKDGILMPNIEKSKKSRIPTVEEQKKLECMDEAYTMLLVYSKNKDGSVTITHRRHSDYKIVKVNDRGAQCVLKEDINDSNSRTNTKKSRDVLHPFVQDGR